MKHLSYVSILLSALITCLVSLSNAWAEPKTVLTLIANKNISRYQQTLTGFRDGLSGYKVIELDLANQSANKRYVQQQLTVNKPDIIFSIGTKAYLAAIPFVDNYPLVFSMAINWRRLPNVKQTYGIAYELLPEVQLVLFKYLFPDIQSVGVLYSQQYNQEWVKSVMTMGQHANIKVIAKAVRKSSNQTTVVQNLLKKVDALWVISDPVVMSSKQKIKHLFQAATQAGKPSFTYYPGFIQLGAALSISVDEKTVGRQAALLIEPLLTNKQGNMPNVQNPAGSRIILNLKLADQLGLKVNEEALNSVDVILE